MRFRRPPEEVYRRPLPPFVVVRSDATKFRPNAEACPSFARYLGEARRAGVRVLAHRVKWSDDGDAESMGPLAVEL